jgi:hypothetical protein
VLGEIGHILVFLHHGVPVMAFHDGSVFSIMWSPMIAKRRAFSRTLWYSRGR